MSTTLHELVEQWPLKASDTDQIGHHNAFTGQTQVNVKPMIYFGTPATEIQWSEQQDPNSWGKLCVINEVADDANHL